MATKIPFELLKGRENFDSWRIGAQAYLSTRKLWKWTTKAPDTEKAAEVEDDTVAKGELTLLLDPSLYNHVAKSVTTKDAWKSIIDSYEDSVVSQKIYTLTKFVNTRAIDFDSLPSYVNAMMKLWTRVQTAGFNIDDKTAGSLMLGGLPEQYTSMVLGIENSGKDITADYVRNLLLQDVLFEKMGNNSESVLWSKEKGKKPFDKKHKKVPKCYNCKGPHYKNKCPELKNFKSDEKNKVLYSVFTANDKSDAKLEPWYIDSGATSHMTHDVQAIVDLKIPERKQVTAADGNDMSIIGMGDIKKELLDGSAMTLKNVHVVPNICANLLSVSRMVLKDYVVTFDKKGCQITNAQGGIIATGRHENGMFVLNVKSERTNAFAVKKKNDDIALWHKRLGHINFQNMRFLNLKIPTGLKCKVCIRGKQPRLPFADSGNRAIKKLELIHSDVGGPIAMKSMSGCKYYVTFIDDFTRKVFVYCLHNKGQVFQCFMNFKTLAENQTDAKIKKFRSDNGTEFDNGKFKSFFEKCGIEYQRSAPYSPQQNGLAERMNRTLLDRVRCMLIDSGLSRAFWAEAINYAARIVNSVPCKGTNKIPDEMWFNKSVDMSTFKKFGCTAFAHVPAQKRKKLDDKGIECVFIGFSDHAKAYRLYCNQTKKLVTSRNVQFIEDDSTPEAVNDDFFIELGESGGDAEKDSPNSIDDSLNSIDDSSNSIDEVSTQEESSIEQDDYDDSLDITPIVNDSDDTEDVDVTVVNVDDSIASDASMMDDTRSDPTFRSTASVDANASRPVTRSATNPSMSNLLGSAFAFCTGIPVTPEEACGSDEKDKWLDAMKSELDSMNANNTWDLVKLPINRKTIRNRWVFARKTDNAGNTIKYKARLVAKGYSQREGIDYSETFAPVARYTSLRYILALSAEMNLELTQMDAVSAFLNGSLEEEVYMDQPKMFDDGTGRVCKLKRSIYGLKQSGRNWNKLLNQTLLEFGLKRTVSDQCVYVCRTNEHILIVMVWVDDVLIAFNNKTEERKLREALSSRFKMKYLGNASVILGINITRNREKGTISVDQRKYLLQVMEKFNMANCNVISTPMDVNTKYSKAMESDTNASFPYREVIGSLLFAAQVTRPDINFSVNLLSRYLDNPKTPHWNAAKRIIRYLKGTIDFKITYTGKSEICGYCDSDYAADIDDRKSTSGFIFTMNGGAISWGSRKQAVVAQSTAEAEYTALGMATKEAIWLRSLNYEILGVSNAIQMYCDNKSAIDMARNNNVSERTKHIDIKLKFVHNEIDNGKILLNHVPSDKMLADVLTKSLTREKHTNCVDKFGLQ